MTKIAVQLSWEADCQSLRRYCGISGTSEDEWLQLLYAVAIEEAVLYLGDRDFTDPAFYPPTWVDGVGWQYDTSTALVSVDVPQGVRVGCYEYVRVARQVRDRGAGIVSASTGAIAESYDRAAALGIGGLPRAAALEWWRPHKLQRLYDGPPASRAM